MARVNKQFLFFVVDTLPAKGVREFVRVHCWDIIPGHCALHGAGREQMQKIVKVTK